MKIKTKARKRVAIIGGALGVFLLLATIAWAAWSSYAETQLNVTTAELPSIEYTNAGTSTNVNGAVCSRTTSDGALVVTMSNGQPDAGCDINDARVENTGSANVLVDGFEWLIDGTPNPDIAENPALDGSTGAPIEYAVTLMDQGFNPITFPHLLTTSASNWVYVDLQIRVTENAEPETVYAISGGGLKASPNS